MPLWEDPENKNGGRVTLTLTGTELLPYLMGNSSKFKYLHVILVADYYW